MLLIAQKEEARIQLQAEEFDLMATAADLNEIEEVNANCILMANLEQAPTSGTQSDKAPVYDSDGSAEVHNYEDCFDNEIFNMFTQEEQYTELLEPILEPHQVPQNDNNVIYEVKNTIVTLQRVVKQRMTLDTHNWSSSAHQELHKIVKDEIFPIVNQVDARVQNFEIQFLKEAAKFVRDFKSLAKEADESLAKHKALELEIERLLREVVSQDIMSVVQNNSVGETSNLQTELKRTKERFKNCIIKKDNEYAKLWNDWYKKSKPKTKPSSSPNDDEEGPSGRDGSVHQPEFDDNLDQHESDEHRPHSGSDLGVHQPVHDGINTATPVEEVCPGSRRSSRPSKFPAKLNEYVLDSKVKYGLNRYVNHAFLSADNYCFVSNLNKSFESSSFEEACKDPNWINAMNDEMHALYENDT
nr:ribonuclease H-like domain-containing protein [Tanacetum cinerariifolium]